MPHMFIVAEFYPKVIYGKTTFCINCKMNWPVCLEEHHHLKEYWRLDQVLKKNYKLKKM